MRKDSEPKTASSTKLEMRDIRQRDLLPKDKLQSTTATVIGTGAVGRQVAMQLAAMGVENIQLFDFDTVEEENLAPQGFLEDDLGMPKVDAVADLCKRINSEINIEAINSRFLRGSDVGNVIFCCVDDIGIRKFIWDVLGDKDIDLFIDGRMSAETLRVITAADEESGEYYPTTIFEADEAFVAPCTAKSTIYCANICAGTMLAQYANWTRGIPLEKDVMLNLTTMELMTEE